MQNEEIEKLKAIMAILQKDIDTTESFSTKQLLKLAIKIRKLEISRVKS